ncbi:MAG: thermonuclease family protein, partial [Terriglobales bacterium]
MIGWRDGTLAVCFAAGCAAIGGSFCATARERPQPAMACGGEVFARGTASRVIDGRTFVLNDGREVRLAAIEVPALPLPQESGAAVAGAAARDALASLLAGTEVVLRQTELQKTDRYGRVVGFASTVRDGVERSVQGNLIAAGLARVAIAAAPRNSSPAKARRGAPSLAFGLVRIMTCSTPITPPPCWPREAFLRWSRVGWIRCAKAEPRFT